jgi:hypothetical protein
MVPVARGGPVGSPGPRWAASFALVSRDDCVTDLPGAHLARRPTDCDALRVKVAERCRPPCGLLELRYIWLTITSG